MTLTVTLLNISGCREGRPHRASGSCMQGWRCIPSCWIQRDHTENCRETQPRWASDIQRWEHLQSLLYGRLLGDGCEVRLPLSWPSAFQLAFGRTVCHIILNFIAGPEKVIYSIMLPRKRFPTLMPVETPLNRLSLMASKWKSSSLTSSSLPSRCKTIEWKPELWGVCAKWYIAVSSPSHDH